MLTTGMLLWIICALLVYLVIRSNRRPKDYPPGPFNLPVVGYLPFLNPSSLHTSLLELGKKYGDIFSLKLGSFPFIVLNSWESIKEALSMQEVSGRPHIFTFEFFAEGHYGIFAAEGSFWKEQRRFVLRHLRDLGMGKSKIEDNIKEEIQVLMNWFQENAGKEIDISFRLNIATTNIIWAIISGKRINHDDPVFLAVMQAVNKNFTLGFRAGILNFIPFLGKVLPEKLLGLDHMKYWRSWFRDWAKSVIKEHQDTYQDDNMRDFIDIYLREMKNQSGNNSTFSEWQLFSIMQDFFVGGGETIAATLRWAILCVATCPEVQKKIQQEIETVVGRNRMPALTDITSMAYTNAVIHEVQRFCDLIPVGAMHSTTEDCLLQGYNIPKGTMIIPNQHTCHRDPGIWEKPYKFYPEHFLDNDGNFRERKEGFLPFSVGKRRCPGESLAKLELFLFLACFLQKFTFSLPDGADASLVTKGDTGLLRHPRPYSVLVRPHEG